MDILTRNLLSMGARMARPGEFSERAFLNNKLDLIQAEAIADLIDSSSEQAALGALRTLQGDFSKRINDLVETITHLRMYVEAAIDFPEEEVDFLTDGTVQAQLTTIVEQLDNILSQAQQRHSPQGRYDSGDGGFTQRRKIQSLKRTFWQRQCDCHGHSRHDEGFAKRVYPH